MNRHPATSVPTERRRTLPCACLLAMALLALPLCAHQAAAAELHTDDFQSGEMLDWLGGVIRTLVPDGGPGGDDDSFLQVQSITRLATHNSNALWTGDLASLEATSIGADLANMPGSDPLEMRVVLFGPNSLSDRWTSTTPFSIPADGVWRNHTFSLAEDDLTRVLGASSYDQMMANVIRVMIRHDPGEPDPGGTDVTATLGVDNIQLAGPATPLPGDYTGDGVVDALDYDAWVAEYGTSGESPADGNGDQLVNAADYVIWRNAVAAASDPSKNVEVVVPEPVVGKLGVAMFLLACLPHRRLAC